MKWRGGDNRSSSLQEEQNDGSGGAGEAGSMTTGAPNIAPTVPPPLPNNQSSSGRSSVHSSRGRSSQRTPRASNSTRGDEQQQQQQQQSSSTLDALVDVSSSSQQQLLTTSAPIVQNTPMSRRREDRYPSGGSVGGGMAANSNASHNSAYSPPRLTPAAAAAAAQRAAGSRDSFVDGAASRSPQHQLGSRSNPISPQSYSSNQLHYQDDQTSTEGGGGAPGRVFWPQAEQGQRSFTQESPSSSSVYHLHQQQQPREDADIRRPSPKHRQRLNKWYFQKRLPLVMSASHDTFSSSDAENTNTSSPRRIATLGTLSSNEVLSNTSTLNSTTRDMENMFSDAEDDYLKTKQSTAVLSIGLTCVQLLILCLQLTMCGIASLDINPFVGPFPDAFSEWGGKNPYLMVVENEWWRLVSPSLLHVGILHLLANAFCQLEPIALFEREWGSARWLVLYLISSVACQAASSLVDPNTIAVGSSGALMGLFAAKLAQVLCHLLFEVHKQNQDEIIRLDQLSSVICGLILVSLLSFFTYIDWSGHIGGLAGGFFSGMVLFGNPIQSRCCKVIWILLGLAGLLSGLGYVFYSLLTEAEFDAEIADSCEYFRSLFPEGYECGCLWQQ